ncbi:MAG TPA: N,N-dimethylformamidase beta subunit family domain-containing protein, partial [Solirubrobacterales bacterium]|nr:N,N-dimethylformamidase beta subunit family domain-containing protein [Solirubrobacterales bacterium]
IYFAKLEREDTSSEGSHIVFVVRDDEGESDLLFQTSDTTWQAYNEYGSNSLYTGGPGSNPSRAYKVSYNRPLTVRQTSPEDSPFNAEYPMVRWLERNGYDVSYAGGVDSDRAGAELLEHEAFLSVGHDEYWSGEQRANVEAARDAGVDLAFFSGNEIFWKTRWEQSIDGSGDEYRTLVSYKDTHADESIDPEGPETWTGTWRDPRFSPPGDGGLPENALSGTAFMVNAGTTEIEVPAADGALRFWRDTDIAALEPGQTATLGDSTLGYEWDEDLDNGFRPAGLVRLSSTTTEVPQKLLDHGNTYGAGAATHHLTLYRAESGALVFGAGTVQWSWGLDSEHDRGEAPPDARMQQATVNLFADMGVQPGTLQAGLVAATASSDGVPPGSTIATPADGGEVELGEEVTVTGTAADSEGESEAGGEVGGVEVSVDGGETWHPAEGRNNWSYTWFPEELGETTILSRAADDSGNLEPSPGEATVEVVELSCPCSIWNETVTGTQDPDVNAVELGVKFRSEVPGYISGLRFYKTAGNTGTHSGRLWTKAGTQLAQVTFSGETATGWQEAKFDTPVEIAAGTTYIASYHAPNGRYASIKSYFAVTGFENAPLEALADGFDGPNGIYEYGPAGGLFSGTPNSFQSENYLVDVVFEIDVGPDETPPLITGRSPVPGAEEIGVETPVSATFNEALDPVTVNGTTVRLRDGEGSPVAASVSYEAASRRIVLDPDASLQQATTYTATIEGGAGGVKDAAGNPLAANDEWSFTTATPPPPPPDQGPGGPILVISNTANPFSRYYGQILEAEGLNEYTVADISTVDAEELEARDVAIVGEGALSPAQAQMLSDWVQDGGNLIAMRPDADLLGLLGLSAPEGTLGNGYIQVDTGSSPGAGIVAETIQFHGTADRYTASGADTVATLFSDAGTSTGKPAVTVREVGPNGGHAAAFTYDLARSIVYTRQGNPAWNADERDGLGAIRSDDLFFGAKAGDPQDDWIDFDKVDIPQADEQQRLLTNLIGEVNLDRKPLPRFWFLPRDEKAAVVMTGDDHGHNGSAGRFESQKALDPPGCSVTEWECVRSTSYIYPNTPIGDAKAAQFAAEGFELALHVTTGCNNWDDQEELGEFYDEQLEGFAASFPSLPSPRTSRTHCIVWSDWASQPKVELERGIRLDTTYYYWPASWVQNRPGMFTGSGMPMRFADLDGSLIDVYQATTQLTDESEQAYPFTSDALLDRALGPDGYYGVFTANMHTDKATIPQSTAIVESALARDVPIVSARQMLTWLDGRNQSSFGSVGWNEGQLSFTIDRAEGADGLRAMVPVESELGPLLAVERGGSPVETTIRTVKGVEYAFFDAEAGAYTASYVDAQEPEISDLQVTVKNDGTATVSWQTDEPADSRVDYGTSPGALTESVSDPAQVTSHSLQLTGLDPDSTYHFRVTSTDGEANPSTEPGLLLSPQSFATPPAAPLLSATDPASPANENAPKIVGSAAAGSTVDIFTSADCTGAPLASGSAATLASPGIAVGVGDDSSTTLRATATSGGGTSACSAPISYVEDSGAPQTQITLKPADLATATTAKFEFAGDDGAGSGVASFECRRDSAAPGDWTACASGIEYTGLSQGAHKFEVRAIDGAGNVDGSPALHEWSIDSLAPETTIDSAPDALSTSVDAEFAFSGDDGAGSGIAAIECRRDGAAWAVCSSPREYLALSQGAHSFEVKAVDQAGNADPSPASFAWTIDSNAPQTEITLEPAALSTVATAKFEFSGDDAGGSGVASFECRRDSTEPGDWTACASGIEYTGLSQGAHKFEVRAIDGAGNVDAGPASHEWSIDSQAPETQITAQPPAFDKSATANFSFNGSDAGGSGLAGFECRRDSADPEDWQPCVSPLKYTSLAQGPHVVEIRAVDQAGNVDASPAVHEWTIDSGAPQTQIDAEPSALVNTDEASFEFSGDDAGGSGVASFECRRDSTEASAWAACSSPHIYTGLADGPHKFEVRAIDQAGNADASPAAYEWSVDTTPPALAIDSGPEGLTADPQPGFGFSYAPAAGDTLECSIDSGEAAFGPCDANDSHAAAAPLANGPY